VITEIMSGINPTLFAGLWGNGPEEKRGGPRSKLNSK